MTSMLIIEPHWEGHHLRYLRWIIWEAAARGYDVYLATSADTLKHSLFLTLQEECSGRIRTVTLPVSWAKPNLYSTLHLVKLEFRYWSMFAECYRQLSKQERLDYVLVPYLDYCTYATAVLGSPFGSTPWGGIVMRPTFHFKEASAGAWSSKLEWIKERLLLRLLRNKSLRVLFAFDELLIQHTQQKRPRLAGRLHFLPEPGELHGSWSREAARRALGIPNDATVVLVYGVLDSSKGIDALLAATTEDRFPKEVSLFLAGPQDAEVRALLASPRAETLRRAGRLHELDKFLYGEDEYAVFQAADIAWIGYRGQYTSSGVLIQAAMAGLPIVACAEGLIGWLTRKHELGFIVSVDDARAVAQAVYGLIHDRKLSAEFAENGRRFSAVHSVDHFMRVVGKELLLNFPKKQ